VVVTIKIYININWSNH